MIKPSTVPGTMELLPAQQLAFDKMIDTIKKCYQNSGYTPLETPLMEKSEILLTKSGGETEKQIYFAVPTGSLGETEQLPKYALRFDLTVPLARFVAQHENDLSFPFKRYQIQRVYRGESAQKGRYREFYQCDVDIIGKDNLSIAYDAELIALIYRVFTALQIGKFTIQINSRKLFKGLFQSLDIDEETTKLVMREIDKLEKIGEEKVKTSLQTWLSSEQTEKIFAFLNIKNSTNPLQELEKFAPNNQIFAEGKQELEKIWEILKYYELKSDFFQFNPCIARGLDYYTSTVIETSLDEHPQIGSICSGGRYENLATHYTKSSLPGVGISIGATRLFYQLDALGLINYPENSSASVMIACLDEKYLAEYIQINKILLENNISNFVYWQADKLKKQFKFADKSKVKFLLMIGEEEQKNEEITVKNLETGEQNNVKFGEIAKYLLNYL